MTTTTTTTMTNKIVVVDLALLNVTIILNFHRCRTGPSATTIVIYYYTLCYRVLINELQLLLYIRPAIPSIYDNLVGFRNLQRQLLLSHTPPNALNFTKFGGISLTAWPWSQHLLGMQVLMTLYLRERILHENVHHCKQFVYK